MVFDYFKKRTEEGIKQATSLAGKAATGKLGEGLKDAGQYLRERQKSDQESLAKISAGLAKSRQRLLGDLDRLLRGGEGLEQTLSSLEEALLRADIGSSTTFQIIKDLRAIAKGSNERLEPDDIKCVVRAVLIEVLKGQPTAEGVNPSAITFAPPGVNSTSVLFVMGANGMGKTTTIGKIAHRLRAQGGLKVLLAAADTFRAAAVEQLSEWSRRAQVDIVTPLDELERPEGVVTRACERAKAAGYDVVIVDTSGRLSNNRKLNLELQAMKRAIKDSVPGGPHDTLLVVDASVGRNAVDQATIWKKEVGVSGLVVTKLDGTARGGFVVSITRDLGVPVKLIGVGEGLDDLRDFDAEIYVDSLLGHTPEQAAALRTRYEQNAMLQEQLRAKMEENRNAAQSAQSSTPGARSSSTAQPGRRGSSTNRRAAKRRSARR